MPPMFEITSCRVVEKHTTHIYKLEESFNLMSKVVSRARISRILDILSGTLNCEHGKQYANSHTGVICTHSYIYNTKSLVYYMGLFMIMSSC